MNNLSAIGNVGRDAEVRFTASGDAITSFSFALTSGYGEKSIASWLNCSIWGKRGQTLAPMLLKGTKIGITGELTNRPYTAKDGAEKYSLDLRVNDITLLGKPTGQASEAPASQSEPAFADFDDSVPF